MSEDPQLRLGELEEPSPLTHLNEKSANELVIVGTHWSPRREATEPSELNIDEIL